MKNDDGKPDIELVWESLAIRDGSPLRGHLIGVNIHPRVWHRLFAAATLVGLNANAVADDQTHIKLTDYAIMQAHILLAAMEPTPAEGQTP